MRCPKCLSEKSLRRNGFYRRKSDSKSIQRLKCSHCGHGTSYAIKDPAYCHNKRRVNDPLFRLLGSNVSGRRSAILLGISRTTVARKVQYLGELCRRKMEKWQKEQSVFRHVQLDELQTIEHTKCKPLSVGILVDEATRRILSWGVASMPATGHLAKIAREKYGYRPDHRKKMLREMLENVRKKMLEGALIQSDDHPYYPPIIKSVFPSARHQRHKGELARGSGQGELKKVGRDPLFSINHTLAMCRANINRLIRKTWCTTKDPDRLNDHLAIYAWFHNSILINA